jgi:hypothetical protein
MSTDPSTRARTPAASENGDPPGGFEAVVETELPEGEEPAARCPHCARPFPTERLRALHVGERHAETASTAEREAHATAREAEADELFVYHLKVIAGIVVLVFTIAYTFAFVLA